MPYNFFAVSISKSKVLPGLKIHAINGSFQNPVPRPWGVGCLYYDVSYLVNLLEVKGNGDIVKLCSVGEGGTLPPGIPPIYSISYWMSLSFISASSVADVTMRVLVRENLDMVYKLTEHFTLFFSTGCINTYG